MLKESQYIGRMQYNYTVKWLGISSKKNLLMMLLKCHLGNQILQSTYFPNIITDIIRYDLMIHSANMYKHYAN